METLASALQLIKPNCYMVVLDLIILFLFLANIESSLDFNLREAYMSLLAFQMGFQVHPVCSPNS